MRSVRARVLRWVGLLCCCAGVLAPAHGAQEAAVVPPAAEPGVWKEQDLDFDYVGFTTHYSCSGLRERVLLVLRLMGARADATTASGCGDSSHHLDRFPYVHLHFAALVPADGGAAAGAGAPAGSVAGQWRNVNLVGVGKLDPNECEFMDQIVEKLVPRFAARNVAKPPTCVPHQETRALALRLDVFAPLAAASP